MSRDRNSTGSGSCKGWSGRLRPIGDRGGSVRLKLSPPELGSLRLEITVNKGVMKARVEAETKEAKNLLLDNLPALRDRLAQQNIKIQKFDVDLRDSVVGRHAPTNGPAG